MKRQFINIVLLINSIKDNAMHSAVLTLPLVLDVTKLDKSDIDEIISILESDLGGLYRVSKERFLRMLDEYQKQSGIFVSLSKTYISIEKHKHGYGEIRCYDDASEVGGTQITLGQLKEHKSDGSLVTLRVQYD